MVEAEANVILPDGRRNMVVSNHSTKTVTAWAFQYAYRAGSGPEKEFDGFQDSVLVFSEKPIAPGAQGILPLGPGAGVSVWNAELRAAVFDDGSAFGDPAWVSRIRDRRLVALDALDAQLSLLTSAAAKVAGAAVTRESLADQLQSEMAARRDRESDPDHRRLIEGMHATVMANLDYHAGKPLGEAIGSTISAIQGVIRPRIAKAAGFRSGSPQK